MSEASGGMKNFRSVRVLENVDTGVHFLDLEYRHLDGGWRRLVLPREFLETPTQMKRALLNVGAALSSSRGTINVELRAALAGIGNVVDKVTNRTGWYGEQFILPDVTIGAKNEIVRYVKQGAQGSVQTQTHGSLEAWRTRLRDACASSSYLTFTVALAFAGVLLRGMRQTEGFVFHLVGQSRTGKGLSQVAAASVIGPASRRDFVTFDASKRGLEEHSAAANDLLLIIDELERLGGTPLQRRKSLSEIAHAFASGRGRVRSEVAAASGLQNIVFMAVGLTSSEKYIEDDTGRQRQRGEEARWIQIPVPPVRENGIFDRLGPEARSSAIAQVAEDTIAANHGHAIRAFLKELTAHYDSSIKYVNAEAASFVGFTGARDSWSEDFARKFGIVYAAARLAARFGIAPWAEDWPFHCVMKLYRASRARVNNSEDFADQLLDIVSRNARSGRRFPTVRKGDILAPDTAAQAWGVRLRISGGRVVAVLRDEVDRLLDDEAKPREVLAILRNRRLTLPGKEGGRYVRQIQVPGLTNTARPLFVCFWEQALESWLATRGTQSAPIRRATAGRVNETTHACRVRSPDGRARRFLQDREPREADASSRRRRGTVSDRRRDDYEPCFAKF
jgi:hypothetical protein